MHFIKSLHRSKESCHYSTEGEKKRHENISRLNLKSNSRNKFEKLMIPGKD